MYNSSLLQDEEDSDDDDKDEDSDDDAHITGFAAKSKLDKLKTKHVDFQVCRNFHCCICISQKYLPL